MSPAAALPAGYPALMLSVALLACVVETEPPDSEDSPAIATRGDSMGFCDAWDTLSMGSIDELTVANSDVADAAELQLRVVRPHRPRGSVFAWNLINPPGAVTSDWTMADFAVLESQAQGREVFGTLQVYTDPTAGDLPVFTVPPHAEEMAAWLDFVSRVVERYDFDGLDDMPGLIAPVGAWEVGNEPTSPPLTIETDGPVFVDWMAATYDAAKASSATTPVLVGGAAPVLTLDGEVDPWVDGLFRYFFEHGGAAYTDAFNFHTFVGVPNPDVDAYFDHWESVVVGVPFWVGEVGSRGANIQTEWGTPADEARWMIERLDSSFERGAERVHWCRGGLETADIPEEVLAAIAEYAGTPVE